ncbi:hypothetical protein QBC43DRAFT_313175 [Cladorrhinum sp. PSN259]|nr:hypothetical protein QBC43DRAFT_313175 [Cladorrhinum sp. PSN259]
MSTSHTITPSAPLPLVLLQTLANHSPLDEISNSKNSVRHHIYFHSQRNKITSKLENSMLFWVYQTGRHGPQNGFRLVLVHRGFFIRSATKEGKEEDEIDQLEREISQGHMEVVILGEEPVCLLDDDDDDDDGVNVIYEDNDKKEEEEKENK